MKKTIWLACMLSAVLVNANAQTTQRFSTEDADVFITRRIDIWSPDKSEMKTSRLSVENKNFNPAHYDEDKKLNVIRKSKDGTYSSSPLARIVESELSKYQATIKFSGIDEVFNQSNYVREEDIKPFLKVQRSYYTDMVIKAGDPAKLADQVSRQSFFGNALSLISTITVGRVLGADAATGFGSVFMDGLANLPKNLGTSVLPIPMNDVDIDQLPDYKLLEIKRIGPTPKSWANGQILIAYKNERTYQMAQDLFVRAIPIALGADTTVEAVDAARTADYEARKAIWAKCVADKDARCK